VPPTFSFDPQRTVEQKSCAQCASGFVLVKGFIFEDDEPHGVYFAALHEHGQREAWIDVILGTFGTEDFSDHVTFGCRVGPVDGQAEPAATIVPAAAPYGSSPLFGQKLSRDEALAHRWLSSFWRVVDFVLVEDKEVHRHVYA
jgi:hypothetical protein